MNITFSKWGFTARACTLISLFSFVLSVNAADKPNVVFIMADDQGYGDIGFTGNPVIKTPEIDKLAKESVWLTDYHVGPSCSPTRSSLITGRWTNRTGVWSTFSARAYMYEDEVTMADHLQAGGYATGLFGKWHLGDHYPFRPQDRGFDEFYGMVGGATGVTADYWNNDLFDDHYVHNGEVVQAKGYCTDVFFAEGSRFIKEQVAADKPFFAYISTNAPHKPWVCPPKYSKLYPNEDKKDAAFYGMITNIDENVGKLRVLLNELGVAENTIFIYTTDNGSAGPLKYNAGMRGGKASAYEGGHRVPLALYWPNGGYTEHKQIDELIHMVDVLPTMLELCDVTALDSKPIDGQSFDKLLGGRGEDSLDWENRMVISDSQRVEKPKKWKDCSVMSGKWRLINGKELYNVEKDPGQTTDVASQNPERFAAMKLWYENWWAELEPTFSRTSEIYLGAEQSPEVTITAVQWIGSKPPWNQGMVRKGLVSSNKGGKSAGGSIFQGHLAVKVVTDGNYAIEVRRWPEESGLKILEGTPAHPSEPGCLPNYSTVVGKVLPIVSATLRIDGKDLETKPVTSGDQAISFTHKMTKGSYKLSPYFSQKIKGSDELNRGLGCYYVTVKLLD